MFTISCKFYTKYIKMASNVMRMKEYIKIYISYFKDIFNIESWIVDKYNQKRQKLDTDVVIGVERRKNQATFNVSQLWKQN